MPGVLLAMSSKRPIITGFPAEILLMIFTIYVMTLEGFDQMKQVLRIAAVCQRFRNVIVHSPLLLANTFHLNAPRVWVNTYLHYLNANEHVSIPQIQPKRFLCDNSSAWQLRLLFGRPYALVERTRSLVLETSTAMWAEMTRFLARRDTHKISNLDITFVSHGPCAHDDDNNIVSPFEAGTTYSNITSLTLRDGVFHLPAASFPCLTQLKVSIDRSDIPYSQGMMTAPQWLDFLRSNPQLVQLTIDSAIKHRTIGQRNAGPILSPVTMPNLQELELLDWQYRGLDDVLHNLRVAPSCNMTISSLVCTATPQSSNGGDIDYIGGLLYFLHKHFTQPNAPTFGPNLFINNFETIRTDGFEVIRFNNYLDEECLPKWAIPELYHSELQTGTGSASGQHVQVQPRLDFSVAILRDVAHRASTFNALYHSIHEKLVLSALPIPLRSVSNLHLSCDNEYFTQSTVQRTFFQALPNVHRLDVLHGLSLFDLRMILDNGCMRERPFPALRTFGLNGVDFTRKWDDECGVPEFDDPFGLAWAVVQDLVLGSKNGTVERVELFACENFDGLEDHLEEFGFEVVPQ